MLIGYARVSTEDQSLELQEDALKAAGCEKIYRDTISGAKINRPGFNEVLKDLRRGDTLVVWRLDRLGRSLVHLIQTVKELNENGVSFKSLQENMDTGSSGGQLIFHIFGALAQFERELIRERTNAGLKAARARGRLGGRPCKMTYEKLRLAMISMEDRNAIASKVARSLGITTATLYSYVNGDGSAKERGLKLLETRK